MLGLLMSFALTVSGIIFGISVRSVNAFLAFAAVGGIWYIGSSIAINNYISRKEH